MDSKLKKISYKTYSLSLSRAVYFILFLGCVISLNNLGLAVTDREPRDLAVFKAPDNFFFGLAGAPAHVEDQLDDIWLDFAKKGGVAAFKNTPNAELRLNFWSTPEVELDLVKSTGVKVYRMGIDWGRVMPIEPTIVKGKIDPSTLYINYEAINRYKEIVRMANDRGLEVMLSLFHHSIPKWLIKHGGWKHKHASKYFYEFSSVIVEEFSSLIDKWITFNEPAVFSALSYAGGIWPPGGKQDGFAFLKAFGLKGSFKRALDNMIRSHKEIYLMIKQKDVFSAHGQTNSFVGVAHNVALYTANKLLDSVARRVITYNLVDEFPNMIIGYVDFLGINYYGEEIVTGTSVAINNEREYSESGRTVNPNGLYQLVGSLNKRYNVDLKYRKKKHPKSHEKIPFVITENGISDASDILRPSYLIEHLRAVRQLMDDGVDVLGYVFWTVSDNWEWADGYCPKFGMFSVDRSNSKLERTPRPSYYLFKDIVKNREISLEQARTAWGLVRRNIGTPRPFCRGKDGKSSQDEPYFRSIVDHDWRFNSSK